MALAAEITVDQRKLRQVQRALAAVPGGVERAQGQAIKRTTDKARVVVVTAVHSDLAVKKSDLWQRNNRRRPIRTALSREGKTVTGGRVIVAGDAEAGGLSGSRAGGRIPLSKFKAKQHWRSGRGRGRVRTRVSYKIDRGGGRRKIEGEKQGPFLLELASGKVGVFVRKGRSRLPLVELHGPSVAHVASRQPKVRRLIDFEAAEELAKQMDSQVDRFLKRRSGRG